MNKKTGFYILTALVTGMLLLSACSSTSGAGSTKGSSGSQTPAQVLQKTQDAMKQLKSVHLDLKSNSTVQTGTPTPSSSSSSASKGITTTLMGNGDENMPDQVSLHLTTQLGTTGQNLALSEVLLKDKVYIQNLKGKWYVIDKSKLTGGTNSLGTGNDASTVNKLLNIAQNAKLTDDGTVMLNGQKLRRLTVTFGKDALVQLLNASGQSNSALPQQSKDQLIKSVKEFNGTVDFWIDENTSYVHQVEEKLMMKLDTSALAATPSSTGTSAAPGSVTSNTDTIIDLSKFNQPVTIKAPANAIPTDNLLSIF